MMASPEKKSIPATGDLPITVFSDYSGSDRPVSYQP